MPIPKLTLVKCEQKPNPDKSKIWIRVFFDLYYSYDGTREKAIKTLVAGVKYLAAVKVDERKESVLSLKADLLVYEITIEYIKEFTPAKLAEIFPPTKTYDGDKFECKDYFYAKSVVEKYSRFTKNFSPELFCWEYWNKDLGLFAVNAVMIIDALNALKGKPSTLEQFFDEYEIDIPKYHERDGLFFDKYGNFVGKPKKKIPGYLRLVK